MCLQCADGSVVCYYDVLAFELGAQVDIVLSPSCGLVLHATVSITLGENTSIRVCVILCDHYGEYGRVCTDNLQADFINITSPRANILGALITSGRGPVDGPGSGDGSGYGGTYGGSGGRVVCENQYFANFDHEVKRSTSLIPACLLTCIRSEAPLC